MEETERPADATQQPEPGPGTGQTGPTGSTASTGSTGDQMLHQLRGLRRSTDDKVIAGVAGGVGRSLGIDPLLLRVVLAVLVLFGGTGIVLYALGWLLMPQDDGTASVGQQALDRPRFRPTGSTVGLAVLLVIAVSIGVIGAFAQWHGPVLLSLAVVAILVLLLRQDNVGPRAAGPAPTPNVPPAYPQPTAPQTAQPTARPTQTYVAPAVAAPPSSGSVTTALPTSALPTSAPATSAPPTPEAPTAGATVPPQPPMWVPPVQAAPLPPRPPKPRSHLFGVTFSLALIALGALGVVDLYGTDVPAGAYPALAIGIMGVGLLVGAWFGRARGLIFWGIVLVPVLAVATIAGQASSISHRAVDRTVAISQVSELPTDARYGAGQVTYDLRQLDTSGLESNMKAQIGFGEIVVIVPRDMDVRLSAKVGVGGLTLFGQETGGVNEHVARTDFGPDGANDGGLDLDLYAGFGHLEVRRATS
ncbi:PspC domain-containing protein [Angustibacter sp. McL0619]|uniref:PspC domain-containing protein n=1 Tax=Angustibacter sp. McL0619 TaxID=3415676 RepID=UPI003CE84211